MSNQALQRIVYVAHFSDGDSMVVAVADTRGLLFDDVREWADGVEYGPVTMLNNDTMTVDRPSVGDELTIHIAQLPLNGRI